MQNYRCGKQIHPNFSVKKDENKWNNHQQVDKKNKYEIKSGDIEVVLLQIFIGINADSHQGEKQQSREWQNKS